MGQASELEPELELELPDPKLRKGSWTFPLGALIVLGREGEVNFPYSLPNGPLCTPLSYLGNGHLFEDHLENDETHPRHLQRDLHRLPIYPRCYLCHWTPFFWSRGQSFYERT